MKIKIPKPYWVVGSFVAAGIITATGYNVIVANTEREITTTSGQTAQIKQVDYSDDIAELKQRVSDNESKITGLQEKVIDLENTNKEKDEEINSLKSKYNTLKKENNSGEVKTLKTELSNVKQESSERKQILEQKTARLNEINVRLKEIAKISSGRQKLEEIKIQIGYLKNKEQTEEVLGQIEDLENQLNQIQKIIDEETALNAESHQIQREMLSV